MREATEKNQRALASATGIEGTKGVNGVCALANFLFDYRVYKHLRMTDSPVFLFHLLIEFHLLKTPPRGHLANCLDFMFSNQIQYWDIFFFFLGCMF